MTWLLLLLVLVALVLGPARPFIFSNPRFFVPGLAGAFFAYLWVSFFLNNSARPVPFAGLMQLIAAAMGFVVIGRTVKQWMDDTFGPRR